MTSSKFAYTYHREVKTMQHPVPITKERSRSIRSSSTRICEIWAFRFSTPSTSKNKTPRRPA